MKSAVRIWRKRTKIKSLGKIIKKENNSIFKKKKIKTKRAKIQYITEEYAFEQNKYFPVYDVLHKINEQRHT